MKTERYRWPATYKQKVVRHDVTEMTSFAPSPVAVIKFYDLLLLRIYLLS